MSFFLFNNFTWLMHLGNPNQFSVANLQSCGLINTGLQCYLNSVILLLHRIQLNQLLLDPMFGGDQVITLLR